MHKPTIINPIPENALPLGQCIAKTVTLADGTVVKGVSVTTHCKIVGAVAKELMRRQPQWLSEALLPAGSELVAACHDIGKVSPHFQEKIYNAAGESLGIGKAALDSTLGGHWTVTQASLSHEVPKTIPEILGRHHGVSPMNVGLPGDAIYGGLGWQKNRLELVVELKRFFDSQWPVIKNVFQANVLSGLTCVADWIGSGTLFNGINLDGTVPDSPWEERIVSAVDSAGFVGFKLKSGLSFEDVFSFQPRDAQRLLIKAVAQPGVYVLEAPMGMGKTEAALYAAYQVLLKGAATGIYFALPTQLTSNKIYDRMNAFLEKILAEDCTFRALLLHSSAWLRDTELGEEGMPGNGWFNSSKRGLLAPFAVGTIDQALMGVMNVKHGFVRTFGLAGKVVILDEVHSYDSYTGTIMDTLIRTLRELHCTVIILSATLTAGRRAVLIGHQKDDAAYPLISAAPKIGNPFYEPVKQSDSVTVTTKIESDDVAAIDEVIRRAERGEQVLWVENIVAESQARFKIIAARAQACNVKIECGLLHSRFSRVDRKYNEERWVTCFGKDGHAKRKECGRILVGTQVLEQSLDIDADFLVSRICPTDMLFQRIGRLWRHREADVLRPAGAAREAWILAPDLEESRDNASVWGKGGRVYLPYVLYRTLHVWQGAKKLVTLPADIRPMLEATYAEQEETSEVLLKCKADVRKSCERLEGLARVGLSSGAKTLPESKAATRHSETESCEVLLVSKKRAGENSTILELLNGQTIELPVNARRKAAKSLRKLAAELQQNVVIVPEYLAPSTSPQQIAWLKDFVYLGDGDESPFRVALVQTDGTLQGVDHGSASPNYELSYSSLTGYHAHKKITDDTFNDLW